MLNLTIAIPVKNEAENLPGCLAAIGKDWAQKIVVIDSGSTDQTSEIAREHGCQVIDFDWNGRFPKKRNWFLRKHTPTTKWVLFLDADEYLTLPFKRELGEAIASNTFMGYWLHYSIYFMGKRLKGGYPLTKLALFQVGKGEYERIDEERWSNMDMEIHEHPILDGATGTLKARIDHRDFRGIDSYLRKHIDYAAWEASRFVQMKNDHALRKQFTWKQKVKYRIMDSFLGGPIFFFGSFVLMGGFRDGIRGFVFAILKMAYFTQIYIRLKEQKKVS